jgi:8-oxo-dGTP pyrophosphatase MutT (NUDIX family)
MVIRAAGGVVWRPAVGGGVEIAVVHRPAYDDWTLPKGKLAPGEGWTAGALREVEEETGQRAELGADLGEVHYRVGEGADVQRKVVRYWAMRATGGDFQPSGEVDEVRWLAPDLARTTLTRRTDRRVLTRFIEDRAWQRATSAAETRHAR